MANKLDQLNSSFGANIGESLGVDYTPSRLHGVTPPPQADPKRAGTARSRNAVDVRIDRIVRDEDQPREEFDPESLRRLADSLRAYGQLQPIRVRWDEDRKLYVIVCGERRWRAAAMAGLGVLACVVHEGDVDVLAIRLIENALREDLKPVEQAKAFRALIDRNNWGPKQLADELAIDKGTVTRILALLTLPESVQGQVEQGHLAATTAYEVSRLPDPDSQVEVARAVVEEGLTRGETAELVRAVKSKRPAPARRPEPVVVDHGDCTVTIKWKRAGAARSPEAVLRETLKLERRKKLG